MLKVESTGHCCRTANRSGQIKHPYEVENITSSVSRKPSEMEPRE